MKYYFLYILLFTSLSCQKSSDAEIDTFFERLSVLTIKKNTVMMNIKNAKTTRTANGGAYIPKVARNCRNGHCDVMPKSCKEVGCPSGDSVLSPILKYEPSHPDANSEGYVGYPNININEENLELKRIELATQYLMDTMPVSKSFFYSHEIQKYFKKYLALNTDFNFEKLLRE